MYLASHRLVLTKIVHELWQDVRYGGRVLRKSPAFTFVAILTLALGIGASTAIFSITYAVVFRPLPFAAPDRLVTVWESSARADNSRSIVSPANYLDWREQSRVFEEIGAYTEDFFNISVDASYPERVAAAKASPNLFQALGARPVLGRSFLPEEGQPGGDRVVLLDHNLWQRSFGADPQVIGRSIKVNGADNRIIGVMPRDFILSTRHYDLYTPLVLSNEQRVNRRDRYLTVIGRLRPGVTIEQARLEMKALGTRLAEQYPNENAGRGATVFPLDRTITAESRTLLLVLLGAVSFALLIACANVANLLLGRASARRREMAVRAALGASRPRLIRQLLTESFMLSLAGGVVGLLLAKWGIGVLVSLSPANIPRIDQVGLDLHVLGYALVASTMTGLGFGLVPALQISKVNFYDGLKEGARSTGGARPRLRGMLVVTEVALSVMLLIGAGLLVKSFIHLSEVDLGFDPRRVIAADISLPARYNTRELRVGFYRELMSRVKALPGVASVAVSQSVPLSGEEHGAQFTIGGRQPSPTGSRYGAIYHRISAQYLNVMGIRLLKGRGLTEYDTAEAPGVVLINEALARKCFPGEDPIGNQIIVQGPSQRTREIVGVVADLRYVTPDLPPVPEIFVSYLDDPYQHMSLAIRAAGDPTPIVAGVRAELLAMDRDVPLANVKAMNQYVNDSFSRERFSALLLSIFAVAALILAAMGLYGVISGSVAQRTHEIGIRIALGAQRRDVLRLVVGQGMLLIVAGVAAGLGAAFALTRVMKSLLFGVGALDPAVFAGVSVLLLMTALAASYFPAKQATEIDPMIALREE